jgi:hypothetical protein
MGEDEISKKLNTEEIVEKGEGEMEGRINAEVVNEVNTTKQSANDGEMHRLISFNWAADADISIGLSPITTNNPNPTPIHSVHTSTVPIDPAPILPKPKPVPGALTNTSPTVPIVLPTAFTPSSITPIDTNPIMPATFVSAPPTAHGPCNFSALHSGV